ncbi:MAG: chloride channel protein [Bacteroidia bacterium]|nr:chloride channel protein [Bacteroidia bacterium]
MAEKAKEQLSIYTLSVITGLAAGLFAMLFAWLLHLSENIVEKWLLPPPLHSTLINKGNFALLHIYNSVLIIIIPALGGLITGAITYFFCKDASGTGADEMINAFHNNEGKIATRVPFIKGITTIFTLASGGSGGKEGPIALIGSGIGVTVAKLNNVGARARRTWLLAGSAAGLGAIFKAPLGGALTAAEMVYKEDIESDALIPCFLSSVVAYLVYTYFSDTDVFMSIRDIAPLTLPELFFYVILGILCFLFGYLFIKGFRDSKAFVHKIKIHSIVKPAIGGLFVGIISLFFYEVSGTGSNYLSSVYTGLTPNFFSNYFSPWWIVLSFLTIAFLKIVATTLTIGSGGSGGIFGPSLFIGGMLGAAVGVTAKLILSGSNIHIGSYIVVGMGAFYAGVANAPVAGIVMICEMTGSYILLPPLIIVSIFTFILSKQISFYKNQVDNRFKSPAHHWDMRYDVIDSIKITELTDRLRNLAEIKETQNLTDLLTLSHKVHASDFIVYTDDGKYKGMISLRKINQQTPEATWAKENNLTQLINASIPSIETYERLSKALNIIMEFDFDKVAVTNNGKYLGYIRSRDIFNSYNQKMSA